MPFGISRKLWRTSATPARGRIHYNYIVRDCSPQRLGPNMRERPRVSQGWRGALRLVSEYGLGSCLGLSVASALVVCSA